MAAPIGVGERPTRRRSRTSSILDGAPRLLLLAPVVLLYLLFFVWPILDVILRSVGPNGGTQQVPTGWSLDNFAEIFKDDFLLRIEWRTVVLAITSTVLTVLLAFPTAYFISRLSRRTGAIVLLLILVPFWISIVVRLFAVTSLLSPNGLLSEAGQLLGFQSFSLLYTFPGVLVGTTMYLLPYMVLILYARMSGLDGNLMQAARTMGASPWYAFRRVYLPMVRPALLSGGLLVFILSLSFFIVPSVLGGPKDQTISVYIQQQIDLYRWGVASAMGVVLLVVTLVCYAGVVRFSGGIRAGAVTSVQAKGVSSQEPFRWTPGTVVCGVIAGLSILVLMLPVLLVFPMSIGETGTVMFPPRGFTFDWYAKVFEGKTWTAPLIQSFIVATCCAMLSVAIGFILARTLQRMRSATFRAVFSGLAFAPLIAPAILLAIGIYSVELRLGLTGTTLGLVLAHTIIAFPFAFALISSALAGVDPELEAAAWTLGASRNRAFWTVVVRGILPSVVGAFALSWVTSWDEVVLALFLLTGATKTLPVTIYQYLESGILPTVPAVASMLVASVVVVIVARAVVSRRGRVRREARSAVGAA